MAGLETRVFRPPVHKGCHLFQVGVRAIVLNDKFSHLAKLMSGMLVKRIVCIGKPAQFSGFSRLVK